MHGTMHIHRVLLVVLAVCLLTAEGLKDTRKTGGRQKAAVKRKDTKPAAAAAPEKKLSHLNAEYLETIQKQLHTSYHMLFHPSHGHVPRLPGCMLTSSNPQKTVDVVLAWLQEANAEAQAGASEGNRGVNESVQSAMLALIHKVLMKFPDRRAMPASENAALYTAAWWLLNLKTVLPAHTAPFKRIFDPEEYEEGEL